MLYEQLLQNVTSNNSSDEMIKDLIDLMQVNFLIQPNLQRLSLDFVGT